MQSKKFKLNLLTAITLAAALVGCGGGSNVSSSASNNGGSSALNSAVSAVTSHTLDVPLLSTAEATAMAKPLFISRPVEAPAPVDAASGLLSAKQAAPNETSVVPHEAAVSASVYTPAQIRAAYQLPPLPTSWTGLTAAQAAQFGAGQTIYIVDAYHNPNAAAELAAFNSRFGLPSCTTVAIPASTALPLAAANPSNGCQFSVVYANTNSAIT